MQSQYFFYMQRIKGINSDFCKIVFFTHLKSDSHLPKKILFIYVNHSPSKMVKNTFYFILKALFVLKIFTFLS